MFSLSVLYKAHIAKKARGFEYVDIGEKRAEEIRHLLLNQGPCPEFKKYPISLKPLIYKQNELAHYVSPMIAAKGEGVPFHFLLAFGGLEWNYVIEWDNQQKIETDSLQEDGSILTRTTDISNAPLTQLILKILAARIKAGLDQNKTLKP